VAPADNEFPHLTFDRVREGRPYYPPSPRTPARQAEILNDRNGHVTRLDTAMRKLRDGWSQSQESRRQSGRPPVPSGQPLVVVVEDGADLDFLRSAFDFEVVAESDDGYVLVLSEGGDLAKFHETLNKFLVDQRGGGSAARLYDLCEDQATRLERVLSPDLHQNWSMIRDDQSMVVDISISTAGTKCIPDFQPKKDNEADVLYAARLKRYQERHQQVITAWEDLQRMRETELICFVEAYKGDVLDVFQDAGESIFSMPDCFTMRVRVTGQCLKDLAENYPPLFEIAEVERIEPFAEGSGKCSDIGLVLMPPAEHAPSVCVIDSGMQEYHTYLQPAILASEAECFVPGEPSTDTADYVNPSGHGTRVAGALLYADTLPAAGESRQLPCWLHNARVLDKNNRIPESVMPALYIERIIAHYADAARKRPARIFNHSINSRAPYRGVHMSTWGAAIDKMSYEKDILVVQSAGNIESSSVNPLTTGIAQHLDAGRTYPEYLLEPCCRIRNPAQSLNALTVGSVSPAAWNDGNYQGISGEGRASAFSPAGSGIWNSIKPDVVEFGGDFARSNTKPTLVVLRDALSLDLPRSTMYSPGATAQDAVGTSFSAPKVSYVAARIAAEFPDEPCLLYRALIANSARWPEWADRQEDKLAVLRQIGYGVPSVERATRNTEHRVTLVTSGEQRIPAREAHVYHVPVPEELRTPGGDYRVRIDVTLSYAAKPRRTRRMHRGYLSTWLDWQVSKQSETFDSFCSRMFRDESAEDDGDEIFRWMLRERSNHGVIEGISRQNGTLQKDWCYLRSYQLPHDFCIAVRGHPGWDPSPETKAKYALVVSFEAVDGDLQIYQHVRTAIETRIEIEARERVTISTEE